MSFVSSLPRSCHSRLRTVLACLALVMLGASAAADPVAEGFERLMAPPGTRHVDRPAMLRPDFYLDFDRRLPLDSVVYSLENGARCSRVLGSDSLWAVDYTWVYPHRDFPSRWYDVLELIRVGDSLGLGDTSGVVVTFGTYRTGVRARTFEGARAEANRRHPVAMPAQLAGRLKLKLDRAKAALGTGAPAAAGEGHR